jgi:exopolysaccharide biosynthesis operon protein EpsL
LTALRALRAAVVAAATVLPATGALALLNDSLELSVAETLSRDDNVFRLSSGLSPAAVLGAPSKADTFRTTTVGLKLDLPVSRQRLQAELALNDTRYDRFTVLNLWSHSGRALWLWQLSDRLAGQIGHSETLSLASLANVQGGVQSSTPNFLTTTRSFADASFKLTPRWQLKAAAARLEQANEVIQRRVNDIEIDSVEAMLSHVTPAGNQAGLNLRLDDARLAQRQLVAGAPVDNAYRQHTAALVGEWILSDHSRVSGRAGWVSRGYREVPQRDHDGATFRLAYDWQPTAKLALNAAAYREISPIEEINVGFVLARGIALRPTYRLSEKLELSGILEHGVRDYRGEAERALGLLPPRTDKVRFAMFSAAWRPTRAVSFGISLRREARTSTAQFGDYSSNSVSVSARIAF